MNQDIKSLTTEQIRLVVRYGSDPRWEDLEGLKKYIETTPLTTGECLFFEKLQRAMELLS